MEELKSFLNERYPSRLSEQPFRRRYYALLLGFGFGILGTLDFGIPKYGTDVARKAPPMSVFVFIIMALVSGVIAGVMSYMLYKRDKKRKEVRGLIYRYTQQGPEEGEDIASLAEGARFVDEGELFELLSDLSNKGILENL